MTNEEWQQVTERAEIEGMTPSQLVRKAVKMYLEDATHPVIDLTQPSATPEPAPKAEKSPKSAPKTPKKAPEPAVDSPEEGEIDWMERAERFSRSAQAARGSKK